MSLIRSFFTYFREWMHYLIQLIKLYCKSKHELTMENMALRSQLTLVLQRYEKENLPKPRPTQSFRQLWVFLSKFLSNWKDVLLVIKPDTVIRWHRTAFKIHWRRKSRKIGRPRIPKETIELIEKLHRENNQESPEKLHERLKLRGVVNAPAPNTIAKYIKKMNDNPKPPTAKQKQSWLTFIKNHLKDTWAVDFFTIPTFNF